MPSRKANTSRLKPALHSSSRGYCPTRYSRGATAIGRQSALVKTQATTFTTAKYTTTPPAMVSRLLYQVWKRFLCTHCRGPGGTGGAIFSGMAVILSLNELHALVVEIQHHRGDQADDQVNPHDQDKYRHSSPGLVDGDLADCK